MRVYNIEIFNTKLEYVATRTVADTQIEFDYLTTQAQSIEVVKLTGLQYGYFIYIREIEYQGYITMSQTVQEITTITFRPLISLCDVDIRYNYKKYSSYTLENQLKVMIEELYKKDICEVKTQIDVLSATSDAKMNLKSQTQNILSVMIKALKMYAVAVKCYIDFNKRILKFEIGSQSQGRTIELNCAYILNSNITIEDTSDYATSVTVYQYEIDENGTVTSDNEKTYYYDEYNDTVTSEPVKRIIPARHSTQEISGTEDFETDAYELAYSKLYRSEFNNSIEVQIDKNNRVIKPLTEWNIGEPVIVLSTDGESYKTIYSGYRINGDVITLLLGAVRTELTKKLLIERRNI